MIPLLTRFAAKGAAVLVLVLGSIIGGHVAVYGSTDIEERDPRQIAADDLRAAQEAHQGTRHRHQTYIIEVADADAETKASMVIEYASEWASELSEAEEAAIEAAAVAEANRNTNPTSVNVPGSCDEFSGNRATGCAINLEWGFDLEQFACLEKLWTKESGWNHLAENSIGAYGIPQSLPGSKMESEGSDWRTNAVTQIRWGLGYIQGRYGQPCAAWAHSQANNWY
ncbi:hypothetical protein [Natronoglycomyces albus]|uniref:Lytic transglycosylase domain-containing protein n=1 Tax=Natronoglycomyces albus TaxID=2811108 RepID=A0A895XUF4_9ACTN|nr:hypothetical protein [Natronoglycomyces albus]QSB05870.1 hypothetical protein JQS30_02790 [Natronoglycomyces albus]